MTRLSARAFSRHPGRTAHPTRFRPALQALEGRALLATLDVAPGHTAANDPNDYPTISAAVAAANPGDTILVAPGDYLESVTIPAAKHDIKIIGGKPTDSDDPHSGPSTVYPPSGSYGFDIQADNVTVQNFTVDGFYQDNTYGFNLARTVSGDQILNNLIERNTFGLYLASNGSRTTVIKNNQFINNDALGSGQGNGIYSDQGARNVAIASNYFTGQYNASILLAGGPDAATSQSYIGIYDNQIIDDAAVIVVNTTQSVISGNTSVRSDGTGILLGGGDSNIAVVNNTLRDGAYSGINLRAAYSTFNLPPNGADHDILVSGNTVTGFGYSGIRLQEGAYQNTVTSNRVEKNGQANEPSNGDGISLETNAHDNYVGNNRSLNNRRDGIRADASTRNNLIEKNTMLGNKEHDAHDDSAGSGTAGTANVWRKNICKTENRPGLCEDHNNGNGNGNGDNGNGDNKGQGKDD